MTHAVKMNMPMPNRTRAPPRSQPDDHPTSTSTSTARWCGTARRSRVSTRSSEIFPRFESRRDPQPELHLRPDKRAKYTDAVAKVLAAAQRNRMKKIGFVNVAEFAD
jgi:biopolymer transport protein ExbD